MEVRRFGGLEIQSLDKYVIKRDTGLWRAGTALLHHGQIG